MQSDYYVRLSSSQHRHHKTRTLRNWRAVSSADVRYIHSFLTIGMLVADLLYGVDAAKTGPKRPVRRSIPTPTTVIKPQQEKGKRNDGGARRYGGNSLLFSYCRVSTIAHISSQSEDRTDLLLKQFDQVPAGSSYYRNSQLGCTKITV